jgi:hypothetical protein
MKPIRTFGQLFGLGKAWRVIEARLNANASALVLNVEQTPNLWPEEIVRVGAPLTFYEHVERCNGAT